MNRLPLRLIAIAAIAGVLPLPSVAAEDQGFPSKPLRMVVPFAPGGTTDAIARIVANKTAEVLGKPIVVDNRPGAGGNVGTDLVARSPADGYTLAMVGNSFTVNPSLYKTMPYRQNELVPVVMAANVPFILVARSNAPFKTVEQLVEYAKKSPGTVSYASGGTGTIGHLGAHWFAELAKVGLIHVPYKGGSQAMTDLVGGQVDIFFDTLVTSTPFLRSGQIHPLFVTTSSRIDSLPQTPTAVEAGFPELEISAWVGLVAPAGTSKETVEKINRAVNVALKSDDVRAKLSNVGARAMGGTAAYATDFMARETTRWGSVVQASGAQAQ